MSADVYYAESRQNAIGVIEKNWVYDRTIKCSIISAMSDKTLTGELKSNNSMIQFTSNMLLRTGDNIQSKKNGTFYPITEILLTNIKDPKGKLVAKDVKDKNVQYELKTFVTSFNDSHEIEFYRGYIERSPKQNEVTY
jgi:hypothetical protein